jgi:hypothetical protein
LRRFESGELLTTKYVRIQTASLVEGQHIECGAHYAGRPPLTKLNDDLSRAHTLSGELWQEVLPWALSHSIESRDVQAVNAIRLIKQ